MNLLFIIEIDSNSNYGKRKREGAARIIGNYHQPSPIPKRKTFRRGQGTPTTGQSRSRRTRTREMGDSPDESRTRSNLPHDTEKQRFQQERLLWRFWYSSRKYTFIQLAFDNHAYLLTEEIYNRQGKKSKFE